MSATPKTYKNILKYGTQANYAALATKDADVLYFCTDTGKLYKGEVDFTNAVVFASTKTGLTNPIVGKTYFFADTGTVEAYDPAVPGWKTISYPLVTTIVDSAAGNDDVHVPSAKAVYDFVEAEIAEVVGGDMVKAVQQKVDASTSEAVEGTIQYVTGDDVAHDVQMTGVVTTPTYDASTRTFTFPVTGKSDVVVELGTDIFIDPTANNRYENGFIYLYLNDGSASSDPTELVIPVTGLVTDYFGNVTDTVTLSVNNSTHQVTADVNVRPDVAGSFTNALKISSTSGAQGLYVDLSDIEADIEQNTVDIAALAVATTAWGTF